MNMYVLIETGGKHSYAVVFDSAQRALADAVHRAMENTGADADEIFDALSQRDCYADGDYSVSVLEAGVCGAAMMLCALPMTPGLRWKFIHTIRTGDPTLPVVVAAPKPRLNTLPKVISDGPDAEPLPPQPPAQPNGRRRLTDQEWAPIVAYAKLHGVAATMKEYGVANSSLRRHMAGIKRTCKIYQLDGRRALPPSGIMPSRRGRTTYGEYFWLKVRAYWKENGTLAAATYFGITPSGISKRAKLWEKHDQAGN